MDFFSGVVLGEIAATFALTVDFAGFSFLIAVLETFFFAAALTVTAFAVSVLFELVVPI